MLKSIKRAALRVARGLGIVERLAGSGWRRQRLLILCYHSLSRRDEHLWKPQLFMQPSLFERRMGSLRRSGANVLPLQEGIQRLYEGELPDLSVAVTFDDGTADFHDLAYPVLREYDFPATVYMTTYYCAHPYPVFRLMCGYLLWRGRAGTVSLRAITGDDRVWHLASADARLLLVDALFGHAEREGLSAGERDELAARVAHSLRIDYDAILESRILQLMRPAEVEELASGGVDFQLHTHRHRSPLNEELYRREIRENRAALIAMTGEYPEHFCYPSGRYHLDFLPWLRAERVSTATTCQPRLASAADDPLLLPRLVDVSNLSSVEFESWISGVGAWFPRRRGRHGKGTRSPAENRSREDG